MARPATAYPSANFRRQQSAVVELVRQVVADPVVEAALARLAGVIRQMERSDDRTVAEKLKPVLAGSVRDLLIAVASTKPELIAVLGPEQLVDLALIANWEEPVAQPALRLRELPGIPGHVLWTLVNDDDSDELKRVLDRGQVWLNVTDLNEQQYRELWGAISYQQQRLGKKPGSRGRRAGSRTPAREALVRAARRHPEWTRGQIYAEGLKRGVWRDDGPYASHPERNRGRVRRIKDRARNADD